jgi:hypothetical protein
MANGLADILSAAAAAPPPSSQGDAARPEGWYQPKLQPQWPSA